MLNISKNEEEFFLYDDQVSRSQMNELEKTTKNQIKVFNMINTNTNEEAIKISNKLQSQLKKFEKCNIKDKKNIEKKIKRFDKLNEKQFKQLRGKFENSDVSSIKNANNLKRGFHVDEKTTKLKESVFKNGVVKGLSMLPNSDIKAADKFTELIETNLVHYPIAKKYNELNNL